MGILPKSGPFLSFSPCKALGAPKKAGYTHPNASKFCWLSIEHRSWNNREPAHNLHPRFVVAEIWAERGRRGGGTTAAGAAAVSIVLFFSGPVRGHVCSHRCEAFPKHISRHHSLCTTGEQTNSFGNFSF